MRIHKTIADNLRSYRKQAGLTQEQLGEKCGLHRTYIGRIEQERANVSLKNIGKIAEALGIDPVLLMLRPDQDAPGKQRRAALENDEHAILLRHGNEVSLSYLDLEDSNLSTHILVSLILEGYKGEQLAEAYKSTYREALALAKIRNKGL